MFNKLKSKMAKKKVEREDESQENKKTKQSNSKSKSKTSKKDKTLERLEELEQELTESKDKFLRLFAEFDNFKKRTAKERMELRSTAAMDTLQSLLPVLDDFDRAKKVAEDKNTEEVFTEGVNLVYQKLQSVMGARGVKKMESTGEDFDPELHEAITEIPAPNEEMKGKIIDTIEPGYYLNDKIIRYAKVVVGK